MIMIIEDCGEDCIVEINGDYGKDGKESVMGIMGDYPHRVHAYPQVTESKFNIVVITLLCSLLIATSLLPVPSLKLIFLVVGYKETYKTSKRSQNLRCLHLF